MDDRRGSFVEMGFTKPELEQQEELARLRMEALSKAQRIFSVGEELEIKGSSFKVVSIGKHEMHLRLLPSLPDIPRPSPRHSAPSKME